MIKLIATDVDGTLIPSGSTHVPEEYFDIIRKLTDKGVKFVVSTGRQEDSVLKTFAPVLDRITMITSDGAIISNKEGLLETVVIKRDTMYQIMNELKAETQCDTFAATHDALYGFETISQKARDLTVYGYGFRLVIIDSLDELPEISKVCIYSQKETRELTDEGTGLDGFPLHPIIKYAGRYEGTETFIAGDEWVDFVAEGVSKGNALKKIQEMYGISEEETISFGDQENDISMFDVSGIGYAVANAAPGALDAADKIIPSYQELGVLGILQEIYNSL